MPITLSDADSTRAIASIKRYASESLDSDVGDLQARLFLDYVLKEFGPVIYARGVADAQAWLTERVSDLESLNVEQPFGYWPKSVARRKGE